MPRVGVPKDEPHDGASGGHPGDGSDPSTTPGDPETAPVRLGTGEEQGGGGTQPHLGTEPQGYTGPDLVGESKDYGKLGEKGRMVDDQVHTAIKDGKEDKAIAQLSDHYEERDVEQGKVLTDAKDLEEPFAQIGVDLKTAKYSSSRVFSQEGPVDRGVVADGEMYDRDGVIVGENRFAQNDLNADANKMRPGDILFRQWERFASHINRLNNKLKPGMTNDVGKLQYFVGRNIRSRSTVETMQTAHQKTNQPLDKPGVFRRESSGAEKEAFDALQGTDFLSSLNYMLKDHHNALGNKRVKEIHTYPRTYDPNTQQGRQKIAIAIIFEEWKP